MKNLRQLLRRPVRNCEAEIWDEDHEDGRYTVYVKCTHLKKPRHRTLIGAGRKDVVARERMWKSFEKDLETHKLCSDPW